MPRSQKALEAAGQFSAADSEWNIYITFADSGGVKK
jgi:hypothetical protein